MSEYCDRCGQEVDTEGGFECEEGLCPFTLGSNNTQELTFNEGTGKSEYVPEYIPEYDIKNYDERSEE